MVMTVAPFGALTLVNFPAAMGLRTKRTQWTAGRSAVKRPWPVISAGSSSRRMARPTQIMPEPLVCAVMMLTAPARAARPRVPGRAGNRHLFDDLPAIDHFCRGFGRGTKHTVTLCFAVQRSFGFHNTTWRKIRAANTDACLGDLASLHAIRDERGGHGEIAGAAAEFVEAKFGVV